MWDDLLRDVRSMGYALTAILTFGVAIGANTGMAVNTQQAPAQSQREAAERIAALGASLDPESHPATSASEWVEERERTTSAIRSQVTRFVESSVRPSEDQETIQAELRSVLRSQMPGLDFSDPPKAILANLRYGRALVLAYIVVRPPHFDSGLLFGFREAGKFQLMATAGHDFDGYTFFTLEMPSPIEGEVWILTGGQAETFNGQRMRYRLYAFDGRTFRTIWSPDDVLGATVRVIPGGFAMTHRIREQPYEVTDEYALTVNGVIRIK